MKPESFRYSRDNVENYFSAISLLIKKRSFFAAGKKIIELKELINNLLVLELSELQRKIVVNLLTRTNGVEKFLYEKKNGTENNSSSYSQYPYYDEEDVYAAYAEGMEEIDSLTEEFGNSNEDGWFYDDNE